MVVDLLLTLEDAVVDIAHLREHSVANNALHSVTTIFPVGSHCLRQLGDLIRVLTDISADVPREIVWQTVTIAHCQFPTVVLHLTGIDPLAGSLTHGGDTFHEEQDVGGLLVIPVETTVDFVSQDGKVETDVMLCGGLPFDVVVTTLVADVSVGQVITAVRTCDIV